MSLARRVKARWPDDAPLASLSPCTKLMLKNEGRMGLGTVFGY